MYEYSCRILFVHHVKNVDLHIIQSGGPYVPITSTVFRGRLKYPTGETVPFQVGSVMPLVIIVCPLSSIFLCVKQGMTAEHC